jgi:CHAD domain-containing protein
MDAELRATYEGAQAAAVEALGSARYFRLLDALEELVRQPPWTVLALGSAQDVLRSRVRKDWKRTRRLVRAAQRMEPGEERDQQLHEVRKAAKRLRYAAEVVVPVFGRTAGRLATAAEELQEVLGDLHDSDELLERLEAWPGLEALAAQERARRDALLEDFSGDVNKFFTS